MFKRGISDEFAEKLSASAQWEEIIKDKELFLALRGTSVNVYYRGCSIFRISYENKKIRTLTHYKYLLRPDMKKPYISWEDSASLIKARIDDLFIDGLDLKSLKKAASYYAGAEKTGIQGILASNKNIIDVEVAFSREAERDQDVEDETKPSKRVADRIDFVALQRIEGKISVVFFEAKRFDNGELRAGAGLIPPVIEQLGRYERLIEDSHDAIQKSYRRICENLKTLATDRRDPLFKEIVDSSLELRIEPKVRLVVFGFDEDQREGDNWKLHRDKLRGILGENLLLRGNPKGFITGISSPIRKARA
jgi:hypothetical protein